MGTLLITLAIIVIYIYVGILSYDSFHMQEKKYPVLTYVLLWPFNALKHVIMLILFVLDVISLIVVHMAKCLWNLITKKNGNINNKP